MMQFFRKYGAPVFAVAALTVLVWMVFELSGLTNTSGSAQNTRVGKVNGTTISLRAFQAAVQQASDSRQKNGSLSAEDIEQIRNDVWDQFVQQAILEKEFAKRDISVSADEIATAIRSTPPPEFEHVPEFQTDSQFDLSKYQRWLQSTVGQQVIPELEARYRDEIMRSKLLRVVTADVYLSDAALWEKYRDQHESVTAEMAAIVPRTVIPDSAVTVAESEIAEYYDKHSDQFSRPRVAYLSYVRIPRFPDPSDTAAARQRAEAARQEIVGGAPFAEVARRESADSASAAKGGDLGEWKKGEREPAFDAAAFSLPLHTVSQPVLTQTGFHLIEVTERKGDKARGRHILIPIEIVGAHRDHLDAEADSLEALGAERLDPAALDTVARALGLKIGQTDPTQEGARVRLGLEQVPDAALWAFRAKPGETSGIIEVPYAYFLFRLDSLHAAGVPPLAQVHAAVEAAVRDQKKHAAARAVADDLLKRVAAGASFKQAAAALKLTYQVVGPFTRVNPPLTNPAVVGAAFGLDSGQVSGPIDSDDGIYVLRGLKRVKPDSAEFVKEVGDVRGRAVQLARQERVRYYMTALREAATVVDERDKVYRTNPQAEAKKGT